MSLNRESYRRLGLPFVDVQPDSEEVEFYTRQLKNRLDSLRSSISSIVSTPNSSQSSGKIGQIAFDNEYFYICTEVDTWKRIPLTEI
jgi:hypothetical protein